MKKHLSKHLLNRYLLELLPCEVTCQNCILYVYVFGFHIECCLDWDSNPQPSGAVVITAAQLHSTKSELRFCSGSNSASNMLEIRDGEDLSQWSRLEMRLNAFCWSIIPQK